MALVTFEIVSQIAHSMQEVGRVDHDQENALLNSASLKELRMSIEKLKASQVKGRLQYS